MPARLAAFALGVMLLAGCELGEVTVAESVSSVIAEVYLRVDDGDPGGVALLHRTTGSEPLPIEGAIIEIRGDGPGVGRFSRQPTEDCIDGELPEESEPVCYQLLGPSRLLVQPGVTLDLTIELPGERRMEGVVTLPSDFEVQRPSVPEEICSLAPSEVLPVLWTQAENAWSYVPEAEINGLDEALAPQGIQVDLDPVTLLGLSISQSDTTIAFPSEFGIFSRFSGDREVLVALQGGIPGGGGVSGRVVVSAQERNATNWNRGGIFNPSGQVRIPSLFGDGTGVVGGIVNRSFRFVVDGPDSLPNCSD